MSLLSLYCIYLIIEALDHSHQTVTLERIIKVKSINEKKGLWLLIYIECSLKKKIKKCLLSKFIHGILFLVASNE